MNLASFVRRVPDFPVPGILFRDITPLLADAGALRFALSAMADPWRDRGVDLVVAIEARGFMFGTAVALELGCGLVPVRKEGKLPWKTHSTAYSLEYRSDVLHIHQDAVAPGRRVLIVDDVLATGGTARATVELVERLEAEVLGLEFLVELTGLQGRGLLIGREVHSLIKLEGD